MNYGYEYICFYSCGKFIETYKPKLACRWRKIWNQSGFLSKVKQILVGFRWRRVKFSQSLYPTCCSWIWKINSFQLRTIRKGRPCRQIHIFTVHSKTNVFVSNFSAAGFQSPKQEPCKILERRYQSRYFPG